MKQSCWGNSLTHYRKKIHPFLRRSFLFPEAHHIHKSLMTDLLSQGQTSRSCCPLSPGPKQTQNYHQRHRIHMKRSQLPGIQRKSRRAQVMGLCCGHLAWQGCLKPGVLEAGYVLMEEAPIGSLDPRFPLPLSTWIPTASIRPGRDEEEDGATVSLIAGYLAALVLLPRTGHPAPAPSLLAGWTQSGNNEGWGVPWRGLWRSHCHPLGPLETGQSWDKVSSPPSPTFASWCLQRQWVSGASVLTVMLNSSCGWQLGISKCCPNRVVLTLSRGGGGVVSWCSALHFRWTKSKRGEGLYLRTGGSRQRRRASRQPAYFPDFSSPTSASSNIESLSPESPHCL